MLVLPKHFNGLLLYVTLEQRQKKNPSTATFMPCISDLPLAYALHAESKRPLQASAEFEGITADLNDVVDESTHGSQGKGRREEHHVAELDKHLLVVLEGVLTGTKWTDKTTILPKKIQFECDHSS